MPSAWQPASGSRLQVSIDCRGRLVLVPSEAEPVDLFRDRLRRTKVLAAGNDTSVSALLHAELRCQRPGFLRPGPVAAASAPPAPPGCGSAAERRPSGPAPLQLDR